jgi:anti-sigma28 factor (negative regulator of flagellin synthesis)
MEHKTLEKPKKTDNSESESEYNLVDFYLQPEFIKIISQQIASQSNIDPEKIQQIKQAINNKSLSIDGLSLAEKIIKFESELFENSNDNNKKL